jgi:hypothetical protein
MNMISYWKTVSDFMASFGCPLSNTTELRNYDASLASVSMLGK